MDFISGYSCIYGVFNYNQAFVFMLYDENLTYKIIGCAYKVHSVLGSGLLESTYEICLEKVLIDEGLKVQRQVALPVVYRDIKLDAGIRIDLLEKIGLFLN